MLQGPTTGLPPDVDPAHKERHLSDADFMEVFGMKKSAFEKVATWMQEPPSWRCRRPSPS